VLAYVFWHRPSEAGAGDYANSLAEFQAALASAEVPGYLGAEVHAVPPLPWSDGPGFEDWYRLEGSASLDPLDQAAVSGARQAAHDAAAARAAWGTAGLYRLRLGELSPAPQTWAHWLPKPPGVRYPEFFDAMRPLCAAPGTALWGRQMTLGPTPEFCLVAASELDSLPWPVALRVPRRRIGPASDPGR